ncbi:MAG: dienelactone hydrolase family protein [Candidatus Saccharibacteria bacterium]|nr:dienelactone hydrolase family protein [Candidatus Saccharibacteria bacterium]
MELHTETINITVPGEQGEETMQAYLARPVDEQPAAAVIVGFELFGLTPHIQEVTRRIASLSYTAVAPDFYHRSGTAITLNDDDAGRAQGFTLLNALSRDDAVRDVAATMDALHTDYNADAIAMVGFSVGGHIAFLAATRLALAASVAFYPGWLTSTDVPLSRPTPTIEATSGIAAQNEHLLVLIGEDDKLISADDRAQIQHALETEHVSHELVVYPHTPHRFFCDTDPTTYTPTSASDAWDRLAALLSTRLIRA